MTNINSLRHADLAALTNALDNIDNASGVGPALARHNNVIEQLVELGRLTPTGFAEAMRHADNLDPEAVRRIADRLADLERRFPDTIDADQLANIRNVANQSDALADARHADTPEAPPRERTPDTPDTAPVTPRTRWQGIRDYATGARPRWVDWAMGSAALTLLAPQLFAMWDDENGGESIHAMVEDAKDAAIASFEAVRDADIEIQRETLTESLHTGINILEFFKTDTLALGLSNQRITRAMEDDSLSREQQVSLAHEYALQHVVITSGFNLGILTEARVEIYDEIYPDEDGYNQDFRDRELAEGFLTDIVEGLNISQLEHYNIQPSRGDIINALLNASDDIKERMGQRLRDGLILIDDRFEEAFEGVSIASIALASGNIDYSQPVVLQDADVSDTNRLTFMQTSVGLFGIGNATDIGSDDGHQIRYTTTRRMQFGFSTYRFAENLLYENSTREDVLRIVNRINSFIDEDGRLDIAGINQWLDEEGVDEGSLSEARVEFINSFYDGLIDAESTSDTAFMRVLYGTGPNGVSYLLSSDQYRTVYGELNEADKALTLSPADYNNALLATVPNPSEQPTTLMDSYICSVYQFGQNSSLIADPNAPAPGVPGAAAAGDFLASVAGKSTKEQFTLAVRAARNGDLNVAGQSITVSDDFGSAGFGDWMTALGFNSDATLAERFEAYADVASSFGWIGSILKVVTFGKLDLEGMMQERAMATLRGETVDQNGMFNDVLAAVGLDRDEPESGPTAAAPMGTLDI